MSLLDEILALTDTVEACIEQGDWLAAGEANAQRQALLHSLCSDGGDSLDERTRVVLREVLDRNRAAEARLLRDRGRIGADASRIGRNRGALRAYRAAAADGG
ncbi:MAG: hypothetical protein D6727_09825 [Gammaproteobacteria bacterium]|nr:MAG: hypothetical protein D6727_09825 [Gammaproteobacteria bacterium]